LTAVAKDQTLQVASKHTAGYVPVSNPMYLYVNGNDNAALATGYVSFEVFTAVTMKNAVCWDITPCGSCKNRRFGGMCASIIWETRNKNRGTRNNVGNNYQQETGQYFFVGVSITIANAIPISSILLTLMMEAIYSYETSVL
jgi:hypothetical protein